MVFVASHARNLCSFSRGGFVGFGERVAKMRGPQSLRRV
jgi:hypothetical protein